MKTPSISTIMNHGSVEYGSSPSVVGTNPEFVNAMNDQ